MHPLCPFSGATRERASRLSQPVALLQFGRLQPGRDGKILFGHRQDGDVAAVGGGIGNLAR